MYSGGVLVKDDGIIGFSFDDDSGVRYCKDTGRIFGINFTYDAYNNFDDDIGGSRLDFLDGFRPPEMKPVSRPIPLEPTIAEICFAENWSLARACEIANANPNGEVDVEDEDYGLVSCTFKDHSMVEFREDFRNIFCIYIAYDTDAGGKLTIPGA